MTDWKKDRKKVLSQSRDFSLPHCMLYKIVKKPGATMVKKTTEEGDEVLEKVEINE